MNRREARRIARKLVEMVEDGWDELRVGEALQEEVNKTHVTKGSRVRTTVVPSRDVSFEGNRGGSYIRVHDAYDKKGRPIEGMMHLEVGETCVRTIDQDISVAGLAMILTAAKDHGLQATVDDYLGTSGAMGSPVVSIDHDLPPKEKT